MTRDDAPEALALYAKGATLAEVGAHFGMSPTWARDLLVRSGRYQPRRPTGRPRKVEVSEVVGLYRQGLVGHEIADRLGCCPAAVYRALHKAGIRAYAPRKARQ